MRVLGNSLDLVLTDISCVRKAFLNAGMHDRQKSDPRLENLWRTIVGRHLDR